MPDCPILTSIKAGIARVTLNRPKVLNALSPQLVDQLSATLDKIAADHAVRVLIITGAGHAFCAGGDLEYFRETLAAKRYMEFAHYVSRVRRALRQLETLEVPTVAAVNGAAVAGGLELLLCCDLVIAARSAKIGDGHVNFGVIPGGGSTVRLPRKLPRMLANQLLYTGELFDAERLERWGLVNLVVDKEKLDTAANDLAARIARNSPLGLRHIKHMIAYGMDHSTDDALSVEAATFLDYTSSNDMVEGLTAFAEHRAPHFSGD